MQKLPLLCMVLPFFLSACEGLTSTQANPNVKVYEAQPYTGHSTNQVYNQNSGYTYSQSNYNQGKELVLYTENKQNNNYTTYSQTVTYNNTTTTNTPVYANNSSGLQVGVVKPYIPDNMNTSYNVNPVVMPVNQDSYVVVKGDTLYSIAFRYGLDYRHLALINNIDPPFNIKVGQVLKLNLQSSKVPVYVVKKGDTLYSIARDNGQSVSVLAAANDLEYPYNLKVGQRLSLAREETIQKQSQNDSVIVAGGTQSTTTTQPSGTTTTTTTVTKPVSTVANTQIYAGKTRKVGGITWAWPAQGKIIENFSLSEQGNKGIDIQSTRGSRILSAADGQVVYAGNALRGYGNLIIINHANEYLSAYAHNEEILVSEGQKVKRGQQIGKMGSTDAPSVRLHFEVRYRGQSVNPISYLPK